MPASIQLKKLKSYPLERYSCVPIVTLPYPRKSWLNGQCLPSMNGTITIGIVRSYSYKANAFSNNMSSKSMFTYSEVLPN